MVLTWDRAFIYEPRADTDVADILEAANVQLLEHRYYDRLLDDELPRMYDLVEETRRAVYLLAPRRFAHLARNLHTLVAEGVTVLPGPHALVYAQDKLVMRRKLAALGAPVPQFEPVESADGAADFATRTWAEMRGVPAPGKA